MLQTGALLVSVLQNRTCALNKQFPQITVAALADAEKLLLASGGVFAGDQPYPRCELAALAECYALPKSDYRSCPLFLLGMALLAIAIQSPVWERPDA